MKLQQLLQDDDAVSPVIGVILMVAITVILAAVIATFVLGLGEQVSSTAPQASFSFDYDEGATTAELGSSGDGVVTITHSSGATISASQLYVSGPATLSSSQSWTDGPYADSSEISAGDTLTVHVNSDDTLRVVWRSDTGQDSATLNVWDGPDA